MTCLWRNVKYITAIIRQFFGFKSGMYLMKVNVFYLDVSLSFWALSEASFNNI